MHTGGEARKVEQVKRKGEMRLEDARRGQMDGFLGLICPLPDSLPPHIQRLGAAGACGEAAKEPDPRGQPV